MVYLCTLFGEFMELEVLGTIASILVLNPEIVKQEGKKLKVVYTPLHGTGNTIAEKRTPSLTERWQWSTTWSSLQR